MDGKPHIDTKLTPSEFRDLHSSPGQHIHGVELEVCCLPAGILAVLVGKSPNDTCTQGDWPSGSRFSIRIVLLLVLMFGRTWGQLAKSILDGPKLH